MITKKYFNGKPGFFLYYPIDGNTLAWHRFTDAIDAAAQEAAQDDYLEMLYHKFNGYFLVITRDCHFIGFLNEESFTAFALLYG